MIQSPSALEATMTAVANLSEGTELAEVGHRASGRRARRRAAVRAAVARQRGELFGGCFDGFRSDGEGAGSPPARGMGEAPTPKEKRRWRARSVGSRSAATPQNRSGVGRCWGSEIRRAVSGGTSASLRAACLRVRAGKWLAAPEPCAIGRHREGRYGLGGDERSRRESRTKSCTTE